MHVHVHVYMHACTCTYIYICTSTFTCRSSYLPYSYISGAPIHVHVRKTFYVYGTRTCMYYVHVHVGSYTHACDADAAQRRRLPPHTVDSQ